MNNIDHGASVVISHHVREDKVSQYEAWLEEISSIAKQSSGLLDWQIVRPIKGITTTFTVLLRFNSRQDLEHWMNSEERKLYIEKAQPLLMEGDDFYVGNGLDFLFIQKNTKSAAPKRWKQFLVTWSAIFPLTFFIPTYLIPLFRLIGLPDYHALDGLLISGTIVFTMVYIVMPRYTKLIQKWLAA